MTKDNCATLLYHLSCLGTDAITNACKYHNPGNLAICKYFDSKVCNCKEALIENLRLELQELTGLKSEIKTCKIIDTPTTYIMLVDNQKIQVTYEHIANYFETHYKSLGYNVERIVDYDN